MAVQHICNVWQEGAPEGGQDECGVWRAMEEEFQFLNEIVIKRNQLGLPLSREMQQRKRGSW